MKFRNPENNFVEERRLPVLWALLFGGLYFIAVGAWTRFVIWVIVALLLGSIMGPVVVPSMIILNIVYALMATGVVRNQYLRRGWVEIADGEVAAPAQTLNLRKCPFCAEEIRAEAVKCKHCGSEVPRGS